MSRVTLHKFKFSIIYITDVVICICDRSEGSELIDRGWYVSKKEPNFEMVYRKWRDLQYTQKMYTQKAPILSLA